MRSCLLVGSYITYVDPPLAVYASNCCQIVLSSVISLINEGPLNLLDGVVDYLPSPLTPLTFSPIHDHKCDFLD